MTSIARVHDSGSATVSQVLHLQTVVQGLGEVDGASVDTIPAGSQELGSAQIFCSADANGNLAAAQTATLAITIQDSADDITFADVAADVLMTAADGADGIPANPVISLEGGVTEAASFAFNLPYGRCRRFVRVQAEWTFSDVADSAEFVCSSHAGGNVLTPAE